MTNVKRLEFDSVSEDTIQCFLFSTSPDTDAATWRQYCESINKTIEALSAEYIWHRDEFKVYLPLTTPEEEDLPPHLISSTCFGDDIEDEWFIVYLVLEITKQYKDLVVQIKDSDGDFLLIEAADYLPPWANPDTTENRVFIYNNEIHIIPPELAALNIEMTLENAIKIIKDSPEQTKVSPEIQQAILKRMGNYPDKIKENIHTAVVTLPIDIATLLTLKPSLIAPIVSAYCNHDMFEARSCRNIHFDLCVNVKVKFTKCLYAMLMHSKLIRNLKTPNINENDKRTILGLKLACGYHIVMNTMSRDIFSTNQYQKFISNLKENGYFKNNIEGSVNYNQLLEKANQFFYAMECPVNSYVITTISQMMKTNEFMEMKKTLQNEPNPGNDLKEDDDQWLNVHPNELNDLLNSRYGQQSKFTDDDLLTPHTITSELSNFLNKTSDFEGIEINSAEDNENQNIEFNTDEFVDSLQNMLTLVASSNEADTNDRNQSADIDEEPDLDREIKAELFNEEETNDDASLVRNLVQSIKEEGAASGPSSNIIQTIGYDKVKLLNSDDN